jgi:hypothetical protein
MAAGKLDVLDTLEGRKAVQAMATYLGIDATNEKQLMWIAERALMAPLPRNWEEISTPDGKVRCRWTGNVSARAASFARARSSHLRLPSDVLHAQRVEDHVVAAPPRRVLQVARPSVCFCNSLNRYFKSLVLRNRQRASFIEAVLRNNSMYVALFLQCNVVTSCACTGSTKAT